MLPDVLVLCGLQLQHNHYAVQLLYECSARCPAAVGPALTAALCSAGLPVGLQLIGKPWHEADLLHASAVIEGARADSMRPPQVYFDVLNPATPTYM